MLCATGARSGAQCSLRHDNGVSRDRARDQLRAVYLHFEMDHAGPTHFVALLDDDCDPCWRSEL
jgi:hypothetical protein